MAAVQALLSLIFRAMPRKQAGLCHDLGMCSHYEATTDRSLSRRHFGVELPAGIELYDLWPGYAGSFIRRPRPRIMQANHPSGRRWRACSA